MYARVHPVQIPGLPGADIVIQLQGLILGQHTHGLNAGINAVGQRKINDTVLAAVGDGGLGDAAGQRI